MNAQWWKVWVLLAGLGVTVLGWIAAPPAAPPSPGSSGSLQVSSPVEDEAAVLSRNPRDRPRQASRRTSPLPVSAT